MWLLPAFAKLNLCLAVRGRRGDGFHDIDSVAVAIDWHDLVGIVVRPAARTEVRLRVSGPEAAGVPRGDDNLAWRAVEAYAAAAGGAACVEVWLDKRLPAAAGLGGGSADAAAVLRLLRRGWPAPALERAALPALAAALGSDVPVLLRGGVQRIRGRGEQLSPVAAPPLHVAVVVASQSSTTAAYGAVLDVEDEEDERVAAVVAALGSGRVPPDDLLGSGLEGPACRVNPVLDERVTALRAAIPDRRWHMTGSGGAMFAVALDAADAGELVACARALGFRGRACRSVAALAE
ncbi:MAG: 4-(cytidine 5'-diphospho)-2-C-methyl-D-erythritol kinase [Candidatus Dormibacteria bacterium]